MIPLSARFTASNYFANGLGRLTISQLRVWGDHSQGFWSCHLATTGLVEFIFRHQPSSTAHSPFTSARQATRRSLAPLQVFFHEFPSAVSRLRLRWTSQTGHPHPGRGPTAFWHVCASFYLTSSSPNLAWHVFPFRYGLCLVHYGSKF